MIAALVLFLVVAFFFATAYDWRRGEDRGPEDP